jgi:hypothetical protein
MSSTAPPRRMKLSIEECLFGPEKKCPSNVWDAVLGGIVPANSIKKSNRNHSEDGAISEAPPVAKQPSKPKEYLGIDEFDANPNGRWARPENVQPHVIPIQELRRIASQGIPDQGSHRSVTWRVLLGGLPYETVNWKDFLLDHRQQYRQLVSDLFVEPQHDGNELRGHQGKKLQQAQQARRRYEESHVYGSPPTSPRTAEAEEVRRKDLMKKLLERRPDMASNSKLIYRGDEDLEENPEPPPKNGDEAKKEEHADVGATPRQRTRRRNSLGDQLANAQIDPAVSVSKPGRRSLFLDQVDQLTVSTDTAAADKERDDHATEKEAAGKEYHDQELNDEPNGFDFQGERSALTHTASEWVRRKSLSDDDISEEVLAARGSGDSDDGGVPLKREDSEDTKSVESLADIVPMHIQEEWKKTGRDVTTLDSMAGVDTGMNTLLVTSTSGMPLPNKGLVSVGDDPLSTDTDSKWFQFFENASLLDEIRKDVVRTHPDLYFFLEPEDNLGQRRYAALERILFVWAKLNKGVSVYTSMIVILWILCFVLCSVFAVLNSLAGMPALFELSFSSAPPTITTGSLCTRNE